MWLVRRDSNRFLVVESRTMRNYGYVRCPCCGRRQRIYVGEVWTGRMTGVQVRIVEPCRDGAIVEQLDRPQDGRFALSWRDLGGAFDRPRVAP